MTAQEAINRMRIQLGETDSNNSRWDDDPHLLFYLNRGRKEFAKQSESIKNIFEQTTTVGATIAGSNRVARYQLDPLIWELDNVYYDEKEVESVGTPEWEERLASFRLADQGLPYVYRRIGDSIDLYFAPNEAKLLEIHASIIPNDLSTLASVDTDLKDDQIQAAIDYGTAMALIDDDRDGNAYLAKFSSAVKIWKKKVHLKGSRTVNVKRDFWWLT